MPSVSKKQHNFMEAIAHNKAFAKKVGIPQSVGQEFSKADKGKTFKKGGIMAKKEMHSEKSEMKMDKAQDKAMIKKAFRQHDMQEHKGGKGTKLALKKGGSAAMCGGGKTVKMAAGGRVKKMAFGGLSGLSPFGATPSGGLNQRAIQDTAQSMTPSYGGNQAGAMGGLSSVNKGANQIGQSLGTIQNALGVGGGSQGLGNVGEPQAPYDPGYMKKGGKVKVKKMAAGGMPVDPRVAAMAAKKAAMSAPAMPMGAKRGMPIAGRAMPPMAATPKGKPMVGRMPPEANMPVPTMKKGGMTKMGAVKTKPGNINGVAKTGLTKGKMVKMAAGGSVGSASRRADGCAVRGKTKA